MPFWVTACFTRFARAVSAGIKRVRFLFFYCEFSSGCLLSRSLLGWHVHYSSFITIRYAKFSRLLLRPTQQLTTAGTSSFHSAHRDHGRIQKSAFATHGRGAHAVFPELHQQLCFCFCLVTGNVGEGLGGETQLHRP